MTFHVYDVGVLSFDAANMSRLLAIVFCGVVLYSLVDGFHFV